MQDFLGRFRFGDFAAYFLPGLATLSAVATIILFTPFGKDVGFGLHSISFAESVAAACAAYLTGALLSGSSHALVPIFYAATRFRRYAEPRATIQPPEVSTAVGQAFSSVFGDVGTEDWSETHFYLMRAAVRERLPHASSEAMRQNDLMRLRENMLLPVLFWSFVGVLYAIAWYPRSAGVALTLGLTVLILVYVVGGRVVTRAVDSRTREVREICASFLVAEHLHLWCEARPRQGGGGGEQAAPAQKHL